MTVSAFLLGTTTLPAMQDRIPIPLDRSGGLVVLIPRSPESRIECAYETVNEELIFSLSNITGTTCIVILNECTGETITDYFWGDGAFYIPFSETGLWTITITLQNGEEYFGAILI